MGTLYTRLSSITSEMSPESIEHHIARVMLEHIHQLNNISIGAMADLCSVSKSTISKFVKQLGFEDYKEFKAEAYSRGKREVYIKDLNTINITDYILQKGTEEYLDVLFSDIRYLFFNTDSKKIDHLVTSCCACPACCSSCLTRNKASHFVYLQQEPTFLRRWALGVNASAIPV